MPVNEVQRYDYVIVGAGIAGASLGYYLADAGRVLLLERESQPGYHSTGRSAAMFMEAYGTPQIQALTRASRAFYERPPAGFSEHPLLAERGCLYVATHEQAAELEARAGIPGVQRIDAAETMRRAPCLDPRRIAGALYEPDARDLDVHALHQGYLRGMRQRGGELLCSAELLAAEACGEGWRLRLGDGRELQGACLVNAAGAWADQVAELCGIPPVGLQPRRRTAFTFEPPEGADIAAWPAVIGIDESFYFKPDAGQLLGSPANADPVPAQDVQPEELDIALGVHHIEQVSRLRIRRPGHAWAGLRSFVADGDLVIGRDPSQPAFFWLAAQGGYGIQSADGVARLARALLLEETLPAGLRAEGVEPERLGPARLR